MRPQIRKRNKNYELTFNDVSVATYLRQFGKAHEKYIPTEIKNLTPKFLHILLNSIFLGDGCKDRNTIYTSSEKLRDDIWEIAFKLGYPASISVSHPEGSTGKIGSKRFKRNHTLWCVGRIGSDIEQTSVTNKNWSIQQYDGNVYCVEVPNHIVCVRRNNKHVWCGNSEEGRASWFDREKTSFVPEGESTKVAYKGSTTRVLDTLVGGMRSGLSYSGAFNIKELREKAVWRRVTGAGSHEARPHGKS